MANNNGPGIDAAFRAANREQKIAIASLDRVHVGKMTVSRQSTLDVLRQVEDTAKTENWIEKSGY
jgi:hypothetical protein